MFNINGILYLLLSAFAALLSITVHEFSHGFAAYKLGDDTAKAYGRLSLNPLKHIDWIGALCLVFLHFGWAKPVPVNFANLKNPKRDVCIVSLAGPLSNFLLAFISLFCAQLVIYYFVIDAAVGYVLQFLYIMTSLNLGLGLFNLIPIPPLDGSKVLASFLPYGKAYKYLSFERYGFIVLFLLLFVGQNSPFGFMSLLQYVENGILNFYLWIIEGILGGLI